MIRTVSGSTVRANGSPSRTGWGLRNGVVISLFVLLLSVAFERPGHAQEHTGVDEVKHYIIGGQPVVQNNYPWMAALTYNIAAELFQRQFCAGTVIADQWVLTAAHCLYDRNGVAIKPSSFKVALNAADLSSKDARELLVSNIYIHPLYENGGKTQLHDIALLELATSSGVTPVPLSKKASDKLLGLSATVIGWGVVNNDDPANLKYPVNLHSADVPIVSLDVCNSPISYNGTIYPSQLCAGFAAGGIDSCTGDSGGPMFVSLDGKLQQVGVVSYGYDCALANFYGVYTDVPYYIGWINQYVFVGEPEFEPEQLDARSSTPIRAAGNSADTGGTSLLALLVLCTGMLLRRRAC